MSGSKQSIQTVQPLKIMVQWWQPLQGQELHWRSMQRSCLLSQKWLLEDGSCLWLVGVGVVVDVKEVLKSVLRLGFGVVVVEVVAGGHTWSYGSVAVGAFGCSGCGLGTNGGGGFFGRAGGGGGGRGATGAPAVHESVAR